MEQSGRNPAAIGEFESHENGANEPNPLPSTTDSCEHNEMVRRGSTVRVRQRASPETWSCGLGEGI